MVANVDVLIDDGPRWRGGSAKCVLSECDPPSDDPVQVEIVISRMKEQKLWMDRGSTAIVPCEFPFSKEGSNTAW
jgi:hypothetical protein